MEELRAWFPLLSFIGSLIGSVAVARYQVGLNSRKIANLEREASSNSLAHAVLRDAPERIRALEQWQSRQDQSIALLEQEQSSHKRQIEDLVKALQDAVQNLQRVALDLAQVTGSKRGG